MAQQHLIRFARAFPRAALLLNRNLVAAVLGRFPSAAVSILAGKAPEADRRVLSEPETRGIFVDATREAFTQGGRGPAWELYLYTHEWQADPLAVKAKTVLWHGELDTTVPVAMGRRHAEQIPDCNPIFLPGEGHFSLPVNNAEPILSALVP